MAPEMYFLVISCYITIWSTGTQREATRTLLRVYDEAQRLFQHVDVPMAWGPYGGGTDGRVQHFSGSFSGAANDVVFVETTGHCLVN